MTHGASALTSALTSRRRHPLAAVVLLIVALASVGALYAAVAGTGTAQAARAEASPQQIERGKQLFLEGCSSCHGLNAQGAATGPSLIGVGAAAVSFQVGTGRMPLAAPTVQAARGPVLYSEEEIEDLAAYVASLAPGPAIPTAEQLDYENADLSRGGELFRTNCAQCHNFAGRGGALTGGKYAPSLEGVSAKHMYEAMLTGPQSMPVFADTTLPEEDKQAIIKYVKTIQAQPTPGGISLGQIGPVSEGLLLWLVGLGLITAVAVWIGVKAS